MSRFRPLRGRGVGVFDTPLQPGTCEGSKNGSVYATVSGVWWAYSIRPYNRVRTILRNTDAILQPGTCEGSKNGSVYATVGGVWWAYSIRPYNRVRAILQKTVLFSSLFGAACGAYTIHSYDWVRAILRNTDAIPRLGTCGPSKNYPVFATVGGVWWGVCDTPLRPGTCDASKYRCNAPIGYVRGFKKWICIRHRR